MNIDDLIYSAIFSEKSDEKIKARGEIRALAKKHGIISSSIYPLYSAIGKKDIKPSFTVPAINIRTLTLDTAFIIFTLMNKHKIGPVVFEIARSEIEYTNQQPDEYAITILAAAIKADYKGPVFLQSDHYQFSKRGYSEDNLQETEKIKKLVKESVDAQFYNIDIDASTLVDLNKKTPSGQQKINAKASAELTDYIRSVEPKDVTVSIGGEIGHIGGKNSTPFELSAFMENYLSLITPETQKGISKISVQTGTSHGGMPLPDGKIADVKLDFEVLEKCGKIARDIYNLAGVVQHGASTLPLDLFNEFPKNKTLEIHLATEFQNIVYDFMPSKLRMKIYDWTQKNCQKEWEEGWSKEQFIYKCRKKALGPFKKDLFTLSQKEKQPIFRKLEKQLSFLFEQLNVFNTRQIIDKYYA